MTVGEVLAIITLLDKCGRKVNIRNIKKVARAINADVSGSEGETECLKRDIKTYQEIKKEELRDELG